MRLIQARRVIVNPRDATHTRRLQKTAAIAKILNNLGSGEKSMGATRIMVIRHAERPGTYDGTQYFGANPTGDIAGKNGSKNLITTGWQRAGALVTLFAPPWNPNPGSTRRLIFLHPTRRATAVMPMMRGRASGLTRRSPPWPPNSA